MSLALQTRSVTLRQQQERRSVTSSDVLGRPSKNLRCRPQRIVRLNWESRISPYAAVRKVLRCVSVIQHANWAHCMTAAQQSVPFILDRHTKRRFAYSGPKMYPLNLAPFAEYRATTMCSRVELLAI